MLGRFELQNHMIKLQAALRMDTDPVRNAFTAI